MYATHYRSRKAIDRAIDKCDTNDNLMHIGVIENYRWIDDFVEYCENS